MLVDSDRIYLGGAHRRWLGSLTAYRFVMRSSIPSCFNPILTVSLWSDGAGPMTSHPFGVPSTQACFTLKSSQRLYSGLHNAVPTRSDRTRAFLNIAGCRRRRRVQNYPTEKRSGGSGEGERGEQAPRRIHLHLAPHENHQRVRQLAVTQDPLLGRQCQANTTGLGFAPFIHSRPLL